MKPKNLCFSLLTAALLASGPLMADDPPGYTLVLEKSQEWLTDPGGTFTQGLHVADVDNDGVTEIITVGFVGQWTAAHSAQMRIWHWDGSALVLEKSEEWRSGSGLNRAYSVFCADVDADGIVEIITAGTAPGGTWGEQAQLRIWNWDGANLTLEKSHEWLSPGVHYNILYDVLVYDVDGDGGLEIITSGYLHPATWGHVQVRTWSWNGTTLTLENSSPIWTAGGDAFNWDVHAADVDQDGTIEILTCGGGGYWNYQPRFEIWNGKTLTLEYHYGWWEPGPPSKHLQSIWVDDVDGDGRLEIVGSGSGHDGTRFLGKLLIWNWSGTTLAQETATSWYLDGNTMVRTVITSNVDTDPAIEIITGGNGNDGSRENAQVLRFS